MSEMLYISKEQTVGCYPVSFCISRSPRHLTTKWELVFWFGDCPIPVKRSNDRSKLEREIDNIIKQSKIRGWKRMRIKSDNPEDYEEMLKKS